MPRDLETIVHKAIDREPGRRYQTAGDLATDLQRFLDDEPIQARRISPAERLGRWCRRNPALAGMAVVIVLVTVLGFAGVFWQWRQAEQARGVATAKAEAEAEARRDRELMLTDMYTSFGLAAGARDDPRQAVLWFGTRPGWPATTRSGSPPTAPGRRLGPAGDPARACRCSSRRVDREQHGLPSRRPASAYARFRSGHHANGLPPL
jgi:hypothetical protein